jgi:cation:H+ antiporter
VSPGIGRPETSVPRDGVTARGRPVRSPTVTPPPDSDETPRTHTGRHLAILGIAAAVTLPAVALRLTGGQPDAVMGAMVFGTAVVGAAFLLAAGAETLELDVSRGLALAVLALIAVLPEYAVDFTFAYKAGDDPEQFAPLALANMTGGNRLLIGVGWTLVVLLAAWRIRSIARHRGYDGPLDTAVHLDRPHAIEIAFLAIATLYSLTLPLKDHITVVDAVVLIGIYVLYAFRISRAPAGEPELVGPAETLGNLPTARRRIVVGALLAYAALVIILSAEPFAESLVETGETLGVSTFLLVQWLAPLASEAPELIVAALFAWRLHTNAGLGTLVSSKVNQWTLLVGTLPLVFIFAGGASSGLPIDPRQREELFLTAAQSAFAVAILLNRSINVREALALFGLFMSQFVLGGVLPDDVRSAERIVVGVVYLVLTLALLFRQRHNIRPLARDGLRTPARELIGDPASDHEGGASEPEPERPETV